MTRNVSGKEQTVDSSDARPLTIPNPVTLSNDFSKIVKPKSGFRGRYAWLGTAASLVIFAVSIFVLWKLVQTVTWAELHTALHPGDDTVVADQFHGVLD